MDEEEGVEATVTAVRGLSVQNDTSDLTITALQSSDGSASVLYRFSRLVNIRGLRLSLLSPMPTSTPAPVEASTTPEETTAQEQTVVVTLKVLTRQSTDQPFAVVMDPSQNTSEVRRAHISVLGQDTI